MEWISIKDRLPVNEECILFILRNGIVHSGYFNLDEIAGYVFERNKMGWESEHFMDGLEEDDVTHWMPLPPPPESPK